MKDISAFPHENVLSHRGMTLRDYFAAQAMQGAIAHGLFNAKKADKDYAEYVAVISYGYADAMMKAREA